MKGRLLSAAAAGVLVSLAAPAAEAVNAKPAPGGVRKSVVLPPVAKLPPLTQPPRSPVLGAPAPGRVSDRPVVLEIAVSDLDAAERPVLRDINAVRRGHGLHALRFSRQLAAAAGAHARVLAVNGHFTHDWSDGRAFGTWILRFYPLGAHRTWSAGENLVWSTEPLLPDAAVAEWLASPPHRRNLLDRRWRELGIGIVRVTNAAGVYGGLDVDVGAAEFGARG